MLKELVAAVRRYTEAQAGESPFVTPIEGVTILRSDHERRPYYCIHKPALCIVVQGAKWATFGNRRIDYGAGQALVVSVEMPAFGRVAEASPSEPYLGVIIEFDLAVMREVAEGLDAPPGPGKELGPGALVTDLNGQLVDCTLRTVRLLETPKAIPVLYRNHARDLLLAADRSALRQPGRAPQWILQ